MARSFLLFYTCWNHSFSRWKFQTLLSSFKSMTDNAIFKFCEQKNLFLISIYWRITVYAGFFMIIHKLPHFFTSTSQPIISEYANKFSRKRIPPHVLLNILYKYDCSIWISNELPILPFECNKRPLPSNKQKHDSIFLNSSSSYNSRWLHYIILQLSHNSLTLYLICFGFFLNFW